MFKVFLSIVLMTVGINDISNSDADIFSNIKRIIFSENSIFILNDSENYCLSESSISDPEKYNIIIRKGNGPSELIRQVDMDIMNNKIFIISRMGNYLIYDVKKKKLSAKRKIKYEQKLGYINKISFIDSNRVFISFLSFSTKKLNIKNNKISHWGIFDLKRNIFKPIWLNLSLMTELAKVRKMQASTILFFTHGVLNQNQIILTYKGADRLFVYDINRTKIIKTINVKLEHYNGFRLKKNKIYGTGIQTPSSFVDKGILYNKALYFVCGGMAGMEAQLLEITSSLKASYKKIKLNDSFQGNVSLNMNIHDKKLFYWENWGYLPRESFGIGMDNL